MGRSQAIHLLATRQDVILTTGLIPHGWLEEHEVAVQLAHAVRDIVASARPSGLVLTGGDVAASVLLQLGAQGLWLLGEVEPGNAAATLAGGSVADVTIVTKAGGFGTPESLARAIQFLHTAS